jgi:integrase
MGSRRRLQAVDRSPVSPRGPGLALPERAAALAAGIPAGFDVGCWSPTDPRFAAVLAGEADAELDGSGLPEGMRGELAWWVATCHANANRRLRVAPWRAWVEVAAGAGGDGSPMCSFAEAAIDEWLRWWAQAIYSRRGRMPAPNTRREMRNALEPFLAALKITYSPAEWWRHDIWDPAVDPRIPRRAHEPRGSHRITFTGIEPRWLAEGMKFYLHLRLETGYWSWTSALAHRSWVDTGLVEFLAARGIDHPALCDDPDRQLRPLALDLASFLRSSPGRHRRVPAPGSVSRQLDAVAGFYAFMADYRTEAAAATGDRRWEHLSDAHGRLWRPDEIGRRGRALRPADDASYIAPADLSRMFAVVELVGLPTDETMTLSVEGEPVELAGMDDASVMRAWVLQALTGRRASEIMMIDFEPIEEIAGLDRAAAEEGAMVAKLRYRQTKIDGAPETILVGADVVAVVAEQQAWVRERFGLGEAERAPYLFPALVNNPRGLRPRSTVSYLGRLRQLDRQVRLRDAGGRPLNFSKSHRLRHTKATTLLNLGAPVHVVQRYLGHRSPEMTMRYAQTLATTAEREFLALAKLGRDGRELAMDRHDLLELVNLDRRTDRVLPNGYCLLPPTKSCERGNACHTCDHFATDRSYLPDIARQLAETEALVAARKDQHLARHGEAMAETNVWLSQRLTEMDAMRREIAALKDQPADASCAVRGAGVLGRPAYNNTPVAVTFGPSPSEPSRP